MAKTITPQYLSLTQAAIYMGMSASWLKKHSTAKNRVIGCVVLPGGKRPVKRFKITDLDAFMATHYSNPIAI